MVEITSDLLSRLAAAQIEASAKGWYGLDVLLYEAEMAIQRLVAERDEARKALATDARIDAIFAAILTTRDNPEDGTRDHLPRPLRNYLSEACGSAGLTGFNDGYAEAQGKFESRATAAEAEVERLRAENAELKAWKKRRQEEDEDEADRREIW